MDLAKFRTTFLHTHLVALVLTMLCVLHICVPLNQLPVLNFFCKSNSNEIKTGRRELQCTPGLSDGSFSNQNSKFG
jgi:hypothetical protein